MKKTFKVFGSLLLATSLIFGVVSCDNPSKGVDGTGVESGTETLGKTEVVTNGSVGKVSTNGDVAELVCEDENGGKYVFTQDLSTLQRSAASVGGTWKYYLNGAIKYSGTFEGDITGDVSTMTLKVEKIADESGFMKETKATTFEFSISDNKFEATIPSVEIVEPVESTDPFVAAIKDVKKYPTNEEEFVEMLETVVTEVSESIDSVMSGNQRSIVTTVGEEAKTALEIVEQVNAFAKAVFECFPEYGSSILDIHKIKIDFDEQINIGKVSFTEWFKALCEVYDNVVSQINEWMKSNEQSPSSEDLVEVMYESLGLTKAQFDDYLVLLDGFVAIDKLYLNLDADADLKHFTYDKYYRPCYDESCENYENSSETCEHSDFGWVIDIENLKNHKDDKLGEAEVDFIFAATVVDVEGLVNTILTEFLASDIGMTLPVKAISAKTEYAVNANLTYGDIFSFDKTASSDGMTIPDAGIKSEMEYKVAVCTKNKVGGIVTITVATSAEKQGLLDFIKAGYNTAAGQITDDMMAKYDEMVSIKITVSDGSEEVYSDTMLYSEFIDFIMEMTGVDVSGSGKVEY